MIAGVLCQKKAVASTLALYHFNSDFLDSSGNGRHLTGSATISSAQSKFGGNSAYFDGSTSLTSLAGAFPALDPSDFTMEFWMHYTGAVSEYDYDYMAWLGEVGGSDFIAPRFSDNDYGDGYALQMQYRNGSGTWLPTTSGTANRSTLRNVWAHIAIVRTNATYYKVYVDGTFRAYAIALSLSLNAAMTLILGAKNAAGASRYMGYIDEFRLSNAAIYTTNFTPPTAPFTA
jgi:hypothetical protein